MSIIATLSTAPTHDGNSSEQIARAIQALSNYNIDYEINPMGTVIETDDISELFAAVQAAYQAIEADRVTTKLEIDHERDRDRDAASRVSAVEEALADNTTTDTTETDDKADDPEKLDSVDMSGHAPEEIENGEEENDVSMKGGDYKTEKSDETTNESLSEKYSGTNDEDSAGD